MKIAVITTLLVAIASSKVVDCTGDLTGIESHKRWTFCTKMAFGHGKMAHWEADVEFNDPEFRPSN